VWKDGEKLYDSTLKSEIYLDDETKRNLRDKTCVELFELFELFFSEEIKNYIIEASAETRA